VIWAHHFDLLPAWLLSRWARIPLLTTFHGPFAGTAARNSLWDALGMTLAIHRGDALSGVSPEVLDSIADFGVDKPHLLENTVSPLDTAPPPTRWPPTRWLVAARSDKVGHLRAATSLFALFRRSVPAAVMKIVAAASSSDVVPAGTTLASVERALRVLGARWCFSQRWPLWRALLAIRWLGYAEDVRSCAREADIVVGMGRVVLEGLAEQRPCVLVGYDDVHGLVTPENWVEWRASNLSGRGITRQDPGIVVKSLLISTRPSLPSVRDSAPRPAAERLARLVSSVKLTAHHEDLEVASGLCEALRSGAGEDALFSRVAAQLSERELKTLYRVAGG
jgi:hypothetical protein